MSVISSNMSALAHASFPQQRLEAIPPEREVKQSSEMPPVEESKSGSASSDTKSSLSQARDTRIEMQKKQRDSESNAASAAEREVNAAAADQAEQTRSNFAKEEEYRGITNMNAVDQNGKYLDLRIPLVDELPDRPVPKVGS